MGFQFEQHRLGLWDLSWEMGLGPPPLPPLPPPPSGPSQGTVSVPS